LALFTHPSGRPTLHFDEGRGSTGESFTLHLDLKPALDLMFHVCKQWSERFEHTCRWDEQLPGAPPPTARATPQTPIPIQFEVVDSPNFLRVDLKIDWIQWMEQFLGKGSGNAAHETWRKVSLSSGTLRLELLGPTQPLNELRPLLQEERLKRL
jgi:hypothetical protein